MYKNVSVVNLLENYVLLLEAPYLFCIWFACIRDWISQSESIFCVCRIAKCCGNFRKVLVFFDDLFKYLQFRGLFESGSKALAFVSQDPEVRSIVC
jgi:hypothetical protein